MDMWCEEAWKHRTRSTKRQYRPGMLSWNYWAGDYGDRKPNPGTETILGALEKALALDPDALIVHHSLNMPASIHFDRIFSRRLRYLWDHDLSLIGYHYLLDSHPDIGNNAQIIKKLGGHVVKPYPPDGWGWVGEIEGGAEREGGGGDQQTA